MTREDRADDWITRCIDELEEMGKKYDLNFRTALVGNYPRTNWVGSGIAGDMGVVTFDMKIGDLVGNDGSLLDTETRVRMFMKELGHWISGHSALDYSHIRKALAMKVVNWPGWPTQNQSMPFSFKVIVPEDVVVDEAVVTEEADTQQDHRELYDKIHRIVAHWIASASDFELYLEVKYKHPKRSIRDTWKESVVLDILFTFDEEESLIEDEKRAEMFLKSIIMPDIDKFLADGYKIKIADPRLVPSMRYLGREHAFKITNAVMHNAITRNKQKRPDEFQTRLGLVVEDHEDK